MSISERRKSRVEAPPIVSKSRRTQRRAIVPHGHPFGVNTANLPRRRFLHLAAGAVTVPAVSRGASAQTYPVKPVRIVVGFAAGGGGDVQARLIGRWLSEAHQARKSDRNPNAHGVVQALDITHDPKHGGQFDILRGKLCIGIRRDVEVTDAAGEHRPLVSLARPSRWPTPVCRLPTGNFASLVLQAAYEATMSAAVLNAQRRGTSNVVLLTQLGGGAFGNHDNWIHAAMRRVLELMSGFELDVRLVSYGMPSRGSYKWQSILSEMHGRTGC
jgi:hypothetical protein